MNMLLQAYSPWVPARSFPFRKCRLWQEKYGKNHRANRHPLEFAAGLSALAKIYNPCGSKKMPTFLSFVLDASDVRLIADLKGRADLFIRSRYHSAFKLGLPQEIMLLRL